jgi:hypothetical protein
MDLQEMIAKTIDARNQAMVKLCVQEFGVEEQAVKANCSLDALQAVVTLTNKSEGYVNVVDIEVQYVTRKGQTDGNKTAIIGLRSYNVYTDGDKVVGIIPASAYIDLSTAHNIEAQLADIMNMDADAPKQVCMFEESEGEGETKPAEA